MPDPTAAAPAAASVPDTDASLSAAAASSQQTECPPATAAHSFSPGAPGIESMTSPVALAVLPSAEGPPGQGRGAQIFANPTRSSVMAVLVRPGDPTRDHPGSEGAPGALRASGGPTGARRIRFSEWGWSEAGRIHLLHYSGVILTALFLFPVLIGGHILSPEVVTLPVLLLPAGTALSQALAVPEGGRCCCCFPLTRESWNYWLERPAARFKALVCTMAFAPVFCIVMFLVNQAWASHLSLIPSALLLAVWPRLGCVLILCAQTHLELILSNAYIFAVPYAGSSSWFVCGVFTAAICLFPVAAYLSLKPLMERRFPTPAQPRPRWILHPSNMRHALLAFCTSWGLGDAMLMVNLFFLHLPVASLPSNIATLLPGGVHDTQLELLRKRLKLEEVLLATAAFLFAICGIWTLVMVLQWSKAGGPGPPVAGVAGSVLPAQVISPRESRVARQARRCQEAEQKAKLELVKANITLEKVKQGSLCLALCCSICQETIQEGDEAARLPECEHGFHWACLSCWFSRRITCPNCQLDVHKVILRKLNRAEQAAGRQERNRRTQREAVAAAAEHRRGPTENNAQDVAAETTEGWLDVEIGPRTIGSEPPLT